MARGVAPLLDARHQLLDALQGGGAARRGRPRAGGVGGGGGRPQDARGRCCVAPLRCEGRGCGGAQRATHLRKAKHCVSALLPSLQWDTTDTAVGLFAPGLFAVGLFYLTSNK